LGRQKTAREARDTYDKSKEGRDDAADRKIKWRERQKEKREAEKKEKERALTAGEEQRPSNGASEAAITGPDHGGATDHTSTPPADEGNKADSGRVDWARLVAAAEEVCIYGDKTIKKLVIHARCCLCGCTSNYVIDWSAYLNLRKKKHESSLQ